MIGRCLAGSSLVCAVVCAPLLCAGDMSAYRGFQMGASLAVSAKHAGVSASETKVVHQRPALIQELAWRPPYQTASTKLDPVQEGLLRFYNGQLFQIVAAYDRQKVQGMTAADMVKAISQTYGIATKPGGEIPYHSNYGETAAVIARWEDSEYSLDLIRTGDDDSFGVVLSSKRLDTLAQAAIMESGLLDEQEAPQRAIALQNRQDVERQLMLDTARSLNVQNFRP
jgi:hypothetical protein